MDTTNVRVGDLSYHSEALLYDRDIRCVIPGYDKMHKIAAREILCHSREIKRVLDLGAGTGNTALCVRNTLPEAELTLMDMSERMLGVAVAKLGLDRVTYLKENYAVAQVPEGFDLVTCFIGLHHQGGEDKIPILKKVYDALNPSGLFLLGDLMVWRNKWKTRLRNWAHFCHMGASFKTDVHTCTKWSHHHQLLNSPSPVEDHLQWMQEVGFKNVRVVFTRLNTVLIAAEKE